MHRFDKICREHDIEHRFTKALLSEVEGPNPGPRAGACPGIGRVKRMNRPAGTPPSKRCRHDRREELRQHLRLFIDAYHHGRRLKTLRGLTPYEYAGRIWTEDPARFEIDPYRPHAGLNI